MKTYNYMHLHYKIFNTDDGYFARVFNKDGVTLFTSENCDTIRETHPKARDYIKDDAIEKSVSPTYEDCVSEIRSLSTQEQLDTIYHWTVSGVINQRTFEQFLLRFFRQR